MAVEIREVAGRRMINQFIHLPAKIHRGHSNWVPPLYMDERAFFNPLKNKSFGYSDVILLLAFRDKQPVGRIMGIINRRYNELKGEKHARFCFLECWKDPEVSSALIFAVEDWARERGMVKLVGPLGFSDKDPQGLLVEGFDKPHVIATTCNYPYLPELVEASGFFKEVDLVVYKLDVPKEIPEIYSMANERILSRNSIVLREFERRKELRPFIRPALQLMNETYVDIYGFDPLTDKEMDEFAARYIPLLDPKFVKVVENDRGKVIGFFICMPDLSTGIKKSRGYLLPFGILHIIRAGKKTKQMNLLLAGIDRDWRGQGLDALMGTSMIKAAHKAGLEYIDSHLMLEHNVKVRAEMERMGGVIYKRYRIFQKPILM
jgi:GNAT superfamily N-acetyltransferase